MDFRNTVLVSAVENEMKEGNLFGGESVKIICVF